MGSIAAKGGGGGGLSGSNSDDAGGLMQQVISGSSHSFRFAGACSLPYCRARVLPSGPRLHAAVSHADAALRTSL